MARTPLAPLRGAAVFAQFCELLDVALQDWPEYSYTKARSWTCAITRLPFRNLVSFVPEPLQHPVPALCPVPPSNFACVRDGGYVRGRLEGRARGSTRVR